ncbi:hypothetical protein EDC04DRAFT_2791154 [Pisolithus marmoratus]|nr:hypothetical protein EDC04DRAFT_2791154 [Pisolithus marmoratus]
MPLGTTDPIAIFETWVSIFLCRLLCPPVSAEILQAPRPSIAEDAYSFCCKEQVRYDSTFTGHPTEWEAWTETHSSKDGESSYSKARGKKRKACDMAT